jgi:hypothetical protein
VLGFLVVIVDVMLEGSWVGIGMEEVRRLGIEVTLPVVGGALALTWWCWRGCTARWVSLVVEEGTLVSDQVDLLFLHDKLGVIRREMRDLFTSESFNTETGFGPLKGEIKSGCPHVTTGAPVKLLFRMND